jgi:hypothetical protein
LTPEMALIERRVHVVSGHRPSRNVELPSAGPSCGVGAKHDGANTDFCVVRKDGDHWEVEAKWPDGTIEQGHKFKASLEAQNWVKTQSAEWLAERLAVPAP